MLTNTLKKIVSFKTVTSDQNENRRALVWVKNQLSGPPLVIHEYKFNGFPSLVATTRKTKTPKVLLQAHIDVVAGSEQAFRPKISKGKLYGRGAFDMKFSIACFLELFQNFGKELKRYNLGLMLTSDEEIGGFDGVGELVKKGYRAKIVFLPDGGSNWSIQKSAKGILRVKVTSRGKSGHGSRPWVGVNAIENLSDFLVKVKKRFPAEPCRVKNHIHDTINVGLFRGGESVNQIPNFAEAYLDIRFTPPTTKAKLQKILAHEQKNFSGISIEEDRFNNPYQINMRDPYIKSYIKTLRSHLRRPISLIDSHGSSDAKFFIAKKIPTILTRPVGGGIHSEKEWIDLASLEKYYLILKDFVRQVA